MHSVLCLWCTVQCATCIVHCLPFPDKDVWCRKSAVASLGACLQVEQPKNLLFREWSKICWRVAISLLNSSCRKYESYTIFSRLYQIEHHISPRPLSILLFYFHQELFIFGPFSSLGQPVRFARWLDNQTKIQVRLATHFCHESPLVGRLTTVNSHSGSLMQCQCNISRLLCCNAHPRSQTYLLVQRR